MKKIQIGTQAISAAKFKTTVQQDIESCFENFINMPKMKRAAGAKLNELAELYTENMVIKDTEVFTDYCLDNLGGYPSPKK